MSAQAVNQLVEIRPPQSFKVPPQTLPDISADQRLIAGKTQMWSYTFELSYNVFGHPDGDTSHGPVPTETGSEITGFHRSFSRDS